MTTETEDPAKPPSLLVVDADEPVSRALKRVLEGSGYRVQSAKDAASASELLSREPIDLAVLDLDTFANDGEQLFQELCKPDAPCPVLVLSRAADPSVREETAQVGKLLTKPVDVTVLLNTVRTLLQSPPGAWLAPGREQRRLVLRRLLVRGAALLRCSLPYRSLYQ